jgi:pyruvate/2-oxoglutarate dehydrogenase complex dihydrolipoamide acyltransferase (E2) component
MQCGAGLGRWAGAILVAGSLVAVAGGGAPARADGVTAEGAQQLEQQLHDWMTAQFGPLTKLGARPLQVSAAGDHYELTTDIGPLLAAMGGITFTGQPFTLQLTPRDGGRWAIDQSQPSASFTLRFPTPPGTPAGPVEVAGGFTSYEQHGVFDPSLATPSHSDAVIKGYKSSITGPGDAGTRESSLDEATLHLGMQPAGDGRVDLTEEGDGHLFVTSTTMPNLGVVSTSIERLQGRLRLDGLDLQRLSTLTQAANELAPVGMAMAQVASANQQKMAALTAENRAAADADRRAAEADRQAVAAGSMTPAERSKRADDRRAKAQERQKSLQTAISANASPAPKLSDAQTVTEHAALLALVNLLSGFEERLTAENLHVSASGHTAHLDRLVTGFAASAPDGRALLRLDVVLDGFSSPDIPPGVFRDYLPRHIALSPRVGGVPVAELREMLLSDAEHGRTPEQRHQDAEKLLADGPLVVGLDELSLDFGPATLTGQGELRFAGFNQFDGEAHLVATDLDALIERANTVPELKQAAPFLFLVKGMGRQDGETMVWDITYRDGHPLVNGNDIAGMIPHK